MIDFASSSYYIGDYNTAFNGTYIYIDDGSQEIELSQALKTNGGVGSLGDVLVSQGAGLPATWTSPGYLTSEYGSFYDTTTQTTLGLTKELMKFNSTDLSFGVSIINDGLGDPTIITFNSPGIYNIQFSAQLRKTGGAGATLFWIYFIKDGLEIPNSTTAVTLQNNGDLSVAAWNFFVDIQTISSFCQIGWYASNMNGELNYDPSPIVGIPAIPSVILTVNKVG